MNAKDAKLPPDNTIIEHLALLSLGQLEADEVAAALSIPVDALLQLLDDRPELMRDAEALAAEMKADPDFAVRRGVEGLNSVVAALAARVRRNGENLLVSELATAGNLLEKLVGVAEQRKAELKAGASSEAGKDKTPIVVWDRRPNPVTGADRFMLFVVTPDNPAWVDFADQRYQAPAFDWLSHYAPLSPTSGECLHEPIKEILLHSGQVMDHEGRLLGPHDLA